MSAPTKNQRRATDRGDPQARNKQKGKQRMNITTIVFKGSSEKMKGHVFQTYAEQGKKGQFITTMAELQVYVAENFKDDAEHFKCTIGQSV